MSRFFGDKKFEPDENGLIYFDGGEEPHYRKEAEELFAKTIAEMLLAKEQEAAAQSEL